MQRKCVYAGIRGKHRGPKLNLSRQVTFQNQGNITPTNINREFDNIVNTWNNHNQGNSTWDNVKATTINATTANVSVGGSNLPLSLVKISSTTASNQGTVDIALPSTGYAAFVLKIAGHQPATNGQDQWIRVSTNAGASYITANYYYTGFYITASSIVLSPVTGSGTGQGIFAIGQANSVSDAVWGEIRIESYGTGYTKMRVESNSTTSGGAPAIFYGGCEVLNSTITNIRLMSASGNITAGTYTLYGYLS